MQTARDESPDVPAVGLGFRAELPCAVDGVLDGRHDLDLGLGVERGPAAREGALGRQGLDGRRVVLVVDEVALVPRLRARHVGAEDDVVERALAPPPQRRDHALQEVDRLRAALLVEDESLLGGRGRGRGG